MANASLARPGQESTTEATCLGDLWALYAVCEEAWLLGRITKQDFEDCKVSATFAASMAIELGREDLVPAL